MIQKECKGKDQSYDAMAWANVLTVENGKGIKCTAHSSVTQGFIGMIKV